MSGCDIPWLAPAKNVCVKVSKQKLRRKGGERSRWRRKGGGGGGGSGSMVVKQEPVDSFFNLFAEREVLCSGDESADGEVNGCFVIIRGLRGELV